MADGASVHDIQSIADFHAYLSRFREELSTRSDEIRVQLERISGWVHGEAPSYWQLSLRKAQQRFSEARDALAMCRAKVREEDHEACTEQQREFEKAKRRVAVCEQKLRELKSVQLAWDQFIQVSRPRLAEAIDLAESHLPRTRAELDQILLILSQYTQGA